MKTKAITKTMTILLALAFTLALAPAVPVQAKKPLKCDVLLEFDWVEYKWFGTITGDIEGDVTITPIEAVFPGSTEHFKETWVIETAVGDISLYQKGVWSFKTFKFKANGMVTAATGDWAYLVDARVHVRGVTTPLVVGEPITAIGTVWICG